MCLASQHFTLTIILRYKHSSIHLLDYWHVPVSKKTPRASAFFSLSHVKTLISQRVLQVSFLKKRKREEE